MYSKLDWCLVVPMANEEPMFGSFIEKICTTLNQLKSGRVYLVVDNASKDQTLALCKQLSQQDPRFIIIWAPENTCVVDAYLRGLKEAWKNNHKYIIEMDAGNSHDPKHIPNFLSELKAGADCVFGFRFDNQMATIESGIFRNSLSYFGGRISNLLLGTSFLDCTSGYQGFQWHILNKINFHKIQSKAHFYHVELKYLLRKCEYREVPISYKNPSPSITLFVIVNSFKVLLSYFWRRISFRAEVI